MTIMPATFKDRPRRIASYNIRKARGLDGRSDRGRIIDVLNGLDADVITQQEADRLIMRTWRLEDLGAFSRMHDLGGPISLDESRAKLRRYIAMYDQSGFSRYCLKDHAGNFVGYVGICPRYNEEAIGKHNEIGWRLNMLGVPSRDFDWIEPDRSKVPLLVWTAKKFDQASIPTASMSGICQQSAIGPHHFANSTGSFASRSSVRVAAPMTKS